jgi:hypothetical protein
VDINYRETLIAVADDCPVKSSVVPQTRAGKKTIPLIQYEILRDNPYKYTSAEVIFEANMRHKGVSSEDLKAKRKRLWIEFFSRPQACLRASGLPKKLGWGILCNKEGKVALCPMESAEYKRAKSEGMKTVMALRSTKGQPASEP